MNEAELRKHRCCFSGHRPEKLSVSEVEAKRLLTIAIKNAIKDGFKTFIVGGARGIDCWVAELIINEKQENPNIRLISAIPFLEFEKSWTLSDQKCYTEILKH